MTTALNGMASEHVALLDAIDPDNNSAGDYTTIFVHKNKFLSFMAALSVGVIASTGTVDARWVEADDDSGTNDQVVAGSAATQLTQAGTDADKQVLFNFDPAVHGDPAKPYIAFQFTTATAAAYSSAVFLGLAPRYGPASAANAASVDEVVTPTRS